MTWQVLEADCVEAMRGMDADSIDAMVTDPPAGISFMGRAWDSDRSGGFVEWLSGVMREALRVTKPGGHALVWALPRTSHWTGSAIEGAGWEIRDRISHHFGSGFPKSLNIGNGQGTALKPATEDWWLARKPLVGTVAQNVERFGTGALNIDRCRIGTDERWEGDERPYAGDNGFGPGDEDGWSGNWSKRGGSHDAGRWPANVALSHLPDSVIDGELEDPGCKEHPDGEWLCAPGCPVAELDRQSGERRSAGEYEKGALGVGAKDGAASIPIDGLTSATYADTGGASRFFATFPWKYQAKASRAERNAGLEGFEERQKPSGGHGNAEEDPISIAMGSQRQAQNFHPTVKPVELMRWLCRLVTPPDGTILDPFTGSGTTGIAAVLEGFDFIGIEREPEYVEITKARIAWWDTHKDRAEEILSLSAKSERERTEHAEAGQIGLFG